MNAAPPSEKCSSEKEAFSNPLQILRTLSPPGSWTCGLPIPPQGDPGDPSGRGWAESVA